MSLSNIGPAWIVALGGVGGGAFSRGAERPDGPLVAPSAPVWWRVIDAAERSAPDAARDVATDRCVSLAGHRVGDLRRALATTDAELEWRPTIGDFLGEGTRGVRARARASFAADAAKVAAALDADAAALQAWSAENARAAIDLFLVADLGGGVGSALAVHLAAAALQAAEHRGMSRGRFRTIAVLTLREARERAAERSRADDERRGCLNGWCALRDLAATIPEPDGSAEIALPAPFGPARLETALFDEVYVCGSPTADEPLDRGEAGDAAAAVLEVLLNRDAAAALRSRLEREEAVAPKSERPRLAVTLLEAVAVGSGVRRREEAAVGALAAQLGEISHPSRTDEEARAGSGSVARKLLEDRGPRLAEALRWMESDEPWRGNSRFTPLAPPPADHIEGRSPAELRSLLQPFSESAEGIQDFISAHLKDVGELDVPRFAEDLAGMAALGLRGAMEELRKAADEVEGLVRGAGRSAAGGLDEILSKVRKRADSETAHEIAERARRCATDRIRGAVRAGAAGAVPTLAAALRAAAERIAPIDDAVVEATRNLRLSAKIEATADEQRTEAVNAARQAAVDARKAVFAALRDEPRDERAGAESLAQRIVAAARNGLREAARAQARRGKIDAAELAAALEARRSRRWIEGQFAAEDGGGSGVSTIAFSGLLAAAPTTNRDELTRVLGTAVDGVAPSPSAALDIVVSFAAQFDPFRLPAMEAGRHAGLRLAAARPLLLAQFLLRPEDLGPRDEERRA